MVVQAFQSVQWTGDIAQGAFDPDAAADAASMAMSSGAFRSGPAWEDQTHVWLFAGDRPAQVSAGAAVRIWRREVEHAAVRLTLLACPRA